MAKKSQMTWLPGSAKPKKPISIALKAAVDTQAQKFVENVLQPKFVLPPSKRPRFNYVIGVTTKWIGSSLYFILTYASPGPTHAAISPTFEQKFARIVFVGDDKFSLSFMRHTSKWVELYGRLSLDECLKAIDSDPWFQPG